MFWGICFSSTELESTFLGIGINVIFSVWTLEPSGGLEYAELAIFCMSEIAHHFSQMRWCEMRSVSCAGEAFHPSDHHQHTDLSVPPNSPTGLPSQHSTLLPSKPSCGQHGHLNSSTGVTAHTSFSPLAPNLHSPSSKLGSPSPDSPTSVHKPSPCKNSHIPAVNTQQNKLGTAVMGCNHPCNGHSTGTAPAPSVNHLTAGACRLVYPPSLKTGSQSTMS